MWLHAQWPQGSPNTFDYFTLLGALQHMVDNELASSPAPKENRREGGYEILGIVLCPSQALSLSRRRPHWVIWRQLSAESRTRSTSLPSSSLGNRIVCSNGEEGCGDMEQAGNEGKDFGVQRDCKGQRIGESAVRLWLLAMSEATAMRSPQHGCLNMS